MKSFSIAIIALLGKASAVKLPYEGMMYPIGNPYSYDE